MGILKLFKDELDNRRDAGFGLGRELLSQIKRAPSHSVEPPAWSVTVQYLGISKKLFGHIMMARREDFCLLHIFLVERDTSQLA